VPPHPPPPWLKRALLFRAGALLALLVLLAALGFALYALRSAEQHELRITQLYARVLQQHADQSLQASALVLRSLAPTAAQAREPTEALNLALSQPLPLLPMVRSLSVLDGSGRVLASSASANIAAQLDLGQLRRGAANAQQWVGSLAPGRDLADLDGRLRRNYAGTQRLLPQIHALPDTPLGPRYLVAVLNPDYFARHYQQQFGDGPRSAALLGRDGSLIDARAGAVLPSGAALIDRTVYRHFLPSKEHGSFTGPGLDGHEVLASFQGTQQFPGLLLVEYRRSAIWAGLRGTLAWALAVTLVGWLGIALLTLGAWRSLHRHEQVELSLLRARLHGADEERNQRLLIDSVQELMFRTDPEGRLQFVNRQWFVDEITLRPVLGQPFADFVDPDDAAIARALFRPPRGGDPPPGSLRGPPTQLRLRGAEGAHRVLEVSVTPVESAERGLIGFAGFAIDVTERELARRLLLEQLEFTARLIEVCPFPIFAKDKAGRYLMVNRAWCDMVGWPVEHVLGKTLPELRPMGDFTITLAKDEQLMREGGTLSYEERVPFPNGTWHDLMVRKTSYANANGEPMGVIGSMVDITDFREVERRTREARDAAERSSAAKGEFLANVSHELRTPLQTILGFSQVGLSRAREQPVLARMFSDIQSAGHRMLHVVNNLLDLSRLETSVGSFKLARGDVRPLLAEVVQELAQLAASRALSLRLELSDWPCMGLLDAFRLQQVFRNILANALRYAPAHSEIELRCFNEPATGGCCVEVRDHGPGIPPDEFESIFAPFVQSSLNQTGAGGTGLGLAISRKIIHVHSGTIRAHNHPDGGAVFEVHLPPLASG